MKIIKTAVWICLFFCVIAAVLPFTILASTNTEKVKVGYYEDGDYMSKNSSGEYIGFNFEYLQEISKYAGWEYEVIDCGSWNNSYSMLKEGEIDLLPAVFYMEERTKDLNFSNIPMCNSYTTLNVRIDDTKYAYADYESFQGMKVGVINDSKDAENFLLYCENNDLDMEIIPYFETSDLLHALESKELDGIAITHLGRNSVFRSVAQFAPDPIYFAVNKDKDDILDKLNNTMEKMKLRDPNYESKLYNKYFSISANQIPVFTKEEKEFIQGSGVTKALYNPSMMPIEYKDANGEFNGIAADLFQEISEQSGLEFEFIPVENRKEAYKMIEDQTADIVCSVENDYLLATKNHIKTTGYYLRIPIVAVSNYNNIESKRIAIPKNYTLTSEIIDANPKGVFLYYESVEECFDALIHNKADTVYANTYITNYLLSNAKYEQFLVTTLMNYSEEICIGISKFVDSSLLSILDKCVQYTSTEQIEEIVIKNTLVVRSVTLDDFVRQYSIEIIAVILIFCMMVVLILLYALAVKSKNNQHIQKLLYRDSLTDLWNLNKFRMEAQKVLDQPEHKNFAVVYIDINQFKTINDTFGFHEGDKLLCSLAEILLNCIAEDEFCARVSADHFVLLLQYQDWGKLTLRTAQIDKLINQAIKKEEKPYYLILAFGVYLVNEEEQQDISLMLDLANYARQSAKSTHKSVTILYDTAMRKEELERRYLADIMEHALKNGEFIPYLQPKINMKTHEVIGAEALVRWINPERGMIMPGEFLPFFERNGFVVEIDMHMYEQICILISRWLREGKKVRTISCNFSRLHFKNDAFPEILMEIAEKHSVPTHYLDLEITESIVMEDLECVHKHFSRLKEYGFLISIDDFGSGYSSLGLLQELPVDVLKLDRGFFKMRTCEKRDLVVINAIVTASHELDMTVVCEGVETKEQEEMLLGMNCHIAQSFRYGKPMPICNFEELIIHNS